MLQFNNEYAKLGNTIKVTSCFFYENEDITTFFYKERIFLSHISLDDLQKNQNNNKIGYLQCQTTKGAYLKIYIVPKTIPLYPGLAGAEILEQFNLYFAEYLRLRSIYNKKGFKVIKDNIIDIERAQVKSVEDYLVSRYERALAEVLAFFKRHSRERMVTREFTSQTITSGINVRRNVTELNKSNVHQAEEIGHNYSRLAELAAIALDCFKREKLLLFSNAQPLEIVVQRLSVYLRKYLSGKFLITNTGTIKARIFDKLQGKIFDKTPETKRLRENLMILVGAESQGQYHKGTQVDSVWFSPEYMYELMVYDQFEHIAEAIGMHTEPKPYMNYDLLADGITVLTNQSVPDLVINLPQHNTRIIIDAKWKMVTDWTSVKLDDILKLHRDKCVFSQHHGARHIILLVYPRVGIAAGNYLGKTISHSYNNDVMFLLMEVAPFKPQQTALAIQQILSSLGYPIAG